MTSTTPRPASHSMAAAPSGSRKRRFRAATAVVLAGLLTVAGTQIVGAEVAARRTSDTGFSFPFAGLHRYEYLAPTQATHPSQINEKIGQQRADEIARKIGLKKEKTLTEEQSLLFISGGGIGGIPQAAELADRSVQIFTNTTGRPLYSDVDGVRTPSVLASYGLFVNKAGLLQSLAHKGAPTRIANILLEPGGYINRWFLANGARSSLIQLYRSAYLVEAIYGNFAQQWSSNAQLVTNNKGGTRTQVGMSMAPALWVTNFALLYTLKPELAALMPAYWTPIPETVANAIHSSRAGLVPYGEYQSEFPTTS